MAYDNYGETRWYLNTGYSKGMTMLSNGNILLSDDSIGPDHTSTGGIVEVDMMGYIRKVYRIDGGYHHDGYELPNGNLLILSSVIIMFSYSIILKDTSVRLFIARCSSVSFSTIGLLEPLPTTTILSTEMPFIMK